MTKRKFPWLKLQPKSQPELPERPPIWFGNRSNTEYYHEATPQERLMQRMVMERADAQARRLGVDRREFLASSMGMFTTLAVINQVSGCGGDSGDGMLDLPLGGMDMKVPAAGMGSGTGGGSPAGMGPVGGTGGRQQERDEQPGRTKARQGAHVEQVPHSATVCSAG